MHLRQIEGPLADLARAQRGGNAGDAVQQHAAALGQRLRQGVGAGRLRGNHGHIGPAVALQALNHAGQQAAAAHGQHHGVGLEVGSSQLIDQGGMPRPQQRVVKRMDKGILGAQQGLGQGIGLVPDGAMHDQLGALGTDQCPRMLGRGLRYDHGDGYGQLPPGIGHGNAGIAARRSHKALLALARQGLAGMAYAAQLE